MVELTIFWLYYFLIEAIVLKDLARRLNFNITFSDTFYLYAKEKKRKKLIDRYLLKGYNY